ncbi:ATP-binding protein [bacterium]|nr:ATP-binding protein [bacterium]
MNRLQKANLLKDLDKKLVFLTGPRQVGKTWLAQSIAGEFTRPVYLNYDNLKDRKIIQEQAWLDDTELLVLDELHKMPEWKNHVKGIFDTRPPGLRMLVTGSARLESFRQSGDSLAGRFFRHRLMPLSPAELHQLGEDVDLSRLMERGGFPEPYLAEVDIDADRWRMQYIDGLIRNDILDFERIHDFRAIQLVFELLRSRVGSPLSYQSISEDVGVSPNTVKKYIQIFESLFIVFRITPHARNIGRSILKEPKLYFYDTGLVDGDEGVRFENLVALSLLKHIFGLNDYHGKPYMLHYLRTKDGAEVDFCIVNGSRPELMIEVKRSESRPSRSLVNFHRRYQIPAIQLVLHLRQERRDAEIEIRKGINFLSNLIL